MQFGKDEHISACPGAEGFNAQNSQAITYPLDNSELILFSIIEMIEWGGTKHLVPWFTSYIVERFSKIVRPLFSPTGIT